MSGLRKEDFLKKSFPYNNKPRPLVAMLLMDPICLNCFSRRSTGDHSCQLTTCFGRVDFFYFCDDTKLTLVIVYVDLVVFTRIAGTS